MFLKTALILSKNPMTDAELKSVMEMHPWAPAMIYGVRKTRSTTWKNCYFFWSRGAPPDGIYVDTGIDFTEEKWLVESFHAPFCPLRPLEEWGDEDFKKHQKLERAWWKATTELLLHSIPENYHAQVAHYGELEDEFEPDVAATAWKELILANYDYDPKIVAEFEAAAA